jgi:multiple sugar transport system permease protein
VEVDEWHRAREARDPVGNLRLQAPTSLLLIFVQRPGRELVFLLFLATMMVPQQVTIIPLFLIMKWLGWVDTHLAIIVPPALFSAFAVFLLRQFIRGIPKEREAAAMIDGCNRFRTYWQIILPLLVPAMSALGIFLSWARGTTSSCP